jgi:hypothetical protein
MPVDNTLDCSQTNPGPRKLGRLVQTLKRLKEFASVGHIKSNPVIANKVGLVTVILDISNFNACFCDLNAESPGITYKIFQDQL